MITFNTENSLTTEKLVRRILNNRLDYEHRNQKKEEKEKAAYQVYRCISKEGNSKGGENDGRLLIGFYYSAVTGNRKQVLTGSSESCEHKCR